MIQQPEDLRSCPFCLGLATLEKIEDGCYGVGCTDCDFQLMNGSIGIGWHESEQEAIAAWNERGGDLAMSQLRAWVKELQDENTALKAAAQSRCLHQIQEPAAAPAAAPVVLPEPDFWVRPGATIHPDRGWQCWSNDGTSTGAFHADTVRTLLATATGLPAQTNWLQPKDLEALQRFEETASDNQGHDISRAAVARLTGFGCLQSHGFGIYSITDFGHFVLDDWEQARSLPFRAQAERDEGQRAAIAAAKGESQ